MPSDHALSEAPPLRPQIREASDSFYCPILWLPTKGLRPDGFEPGQVCQGKFESGPNWRHRSNSLAHDGPETGDVTFDDSLC